MLESLGYKIPEGSPLKDGLQGAGEVEIVYSGLEEIMEEACEKNWAYAVEHNLCFRDACLGKSIQNIHEHYQLAGIMI
jgi:hypothetical protein